MIYLLDTCVISEVIAKQPNQQVLDWLDAQVPETLYLSVITIGEIAKGISKLTASKRKESLTKWLNEILPNRFEHRILSIDVSTMVLWGNLVGQLEQNGRPLPVMDSLIAALAKPAVRVASRREGIALQNSLSLVTRNENDFTGTGVVIVNPWSV